MNHNTRRAFAIQAIAIRQNGEGRSVHSNIVSANNEAQALLQTQPSILAELRIMSEAMVNPCAHCLSRLGTVEILVMVADASFGEESERPSANYLLRIDGTWVEEELANQRQVLWEWAEVTLGPGAEQNTAAGQPARKTDPRLH